MTAERFAYALRRAIAASDTLPAVDLKGVPEPYRGILQDVTPTAWGSQAGEDLSLRVRSIETAGAEKSRPGTPGILAEFPFVGGARLQDAYINAYETAPEAVERINAAVLSALRDRQTLVLASEGSTLDVDLRGAEFYADGVTFDGKSPSLQLPGGEVFADLETNATEGEVVVDISLAGPKVPAVLTFENGRLKAVSSIADAAAVTIRKFVKLEGARLTEIGFGTNPDAIDIGGGCLFEKELGTWHLGLEILTNNLGIDHVDLRGLTPMPSHLQKVILVADRVQA